MKSYLMPGLDATQLDRLRQAGVVYYDWAANEILVEETHLQAALKTLGATATEEATQYENTFKLALRFSAQTASQRQTAVDDSPRARARAHYIKICSARVQAVLTEAQTALAERRKQLPASSNQFAALSRAAALASEPLHARKATELADEVERIQEMPQVKEIRVVPGALLVYTTMLYCTTSGARTKCPVGEFMIRMQLDGTDGGVRWFNGTRRVNCVRQAMNAPNVYADGTPFADEIVQTLIELIAQCQFAVVAELAIQFIESAAVGDQTAWMKNP